MTEIISKLDYSILSAYHTLAEACGGFLTPLAKFFTFIGEGGVWMFVLGGLLMLFPKTRKIGVCLFGAVGCGALITNIILKDFVARLRPFDVSNTYKLWWAYIGAPIADGFSCPSGHATSSVAGVLALTLIHNKKHLYWGIPYVLLMCFSRNYLMAHFPSDVIAGLIVGVISAYVAYAITWIIFRLLERYKEYGFCYFLLYQVDAGKLLNKIFKRQ